MIILVKDIKGSPHKHTVKVILKDKISKEDTVKVTLEYREMLLLEDKLKSIDKTKFEATLEDRVKTNP
jgi:hypothetical protein